MEPRRNNNNRVARRIADRHIVIVVAPDLREANVIRREEPVCDMSGQINNTVTVYVASHGAILTAVFSLQGPIGSEICARVLILSGVISTAIIMTLFHISYQQFGRMRAGQGLRNSLVANWRWISQRAAFVLMVMGLSICLFFTCSALLFSRVP